MDNNGLIDWKPGFSQSCCFRKPVQYPAAVPFADKFSITVAAVYLPKYNKIH